jgi:hypothetical protein
MASSPQAKRAKTSAASEKDAFVKLFQPLLDQVIDDLEKRLACSSILSRTPTQTLHSLSARTPQHKMFHAHAHALQPPHRHQPSNHSQPTPVDFSCARSYPDYDKDALAWFKKSMEYNCVGGIFAHTPPRHHHLAHHTHTCHMRPSLRLLRSLLLCTLAAHRHSLVNRRHSLATRVSANQQSALVLLGSAALSEVSWRCAQLVEVAVV